MGYSLPQIAEVLSKTDKTLYKVGAIAYENMFSELSESLDYERDIVFVYKKAVEWADDFYVGDVRTDAIVERLSLKISIYDYGSLNPIYSGAVSITNTLPGNYYLYQLGDVNITNLQNNQVLTYNSVLGMWVNSGGNTAVRTNLSFTATLNQTTFVTSAPFTTGLLDVYLNGVKLNSSNYSTFGEYSITLYDGCLADDIIDVIIYGTSTSILDLSSYVLKSTTITINGVTYDLSTNRTWTIDALPSQAGNSGKYLTTNGSVASWGTIALTGYVPYTGATTNLDLGEYELKAGQLSLDVSPTGTAAVGTTQWNNTIGASETTLKGGSVVLKNGVDLVARVVNKVTPNATLTKAAYQAVRVSGAQGQRLEVAYAQANNDANSAETIGLVCETIATNQEGFILTMGQLENINTTGSLQGETWVDGDVLYLSPFTAGAVTKVKPTGAGHIVVIGYVEYAHVNNGKIYVKVMNGWELDELHDVSIVSAANNEALIYESSTQLWKNKTIASALGFTPVPTSRTLTINGTTYDLSADRSWTIAAGITGSGVANQLTYWNGTGSVTGSSNLVWDNTNSRLGINTNVPSTTLQVNGNALVENSANVARTLTISNSFNGIDSSANLILNSNASSGSSQVFKYASGRNAYKFISPSDFGHYNGTSGGDISFLNDFATGKIKFGAGGSSTAQMTLTSAGRLLLGTITESTFILDANGTSRLNGNTTIGGFISASSYLSCGSSIFINSIAHSSNITTDTLGNGSTNLTLSSNNAMFNFGNTARYTFGINNTDRNVGIQDFGTGYVTNNLSSILTLTSTTKGFLPPRMTSAERSAISAATGLIVYQTDGTEGLYEKTSSAWRIINGGGGGSVDELQVALISQVYG